MFCDHLAYMLCNSPATCGMWEGRWMPHEERGYKRGGCAAEAGDRRSRAERASWLFALRGSDPVALPRRL